jgi:hypothetical protein
MDEELKSLEREKAKLLRKLESVGDMRKGSLSVRFQKCGKSPCACDDPKHPGHGPIYSLSTPILGKTKIRNYKLGTELAKIQNELKNYKVFKETSKALIEVNQEICEKRPVEAIEDEDELSRLKKKLQRIYKRKLPKK